MAFLNIDGVTLHYVLAGDTGDALVLIHGYGGDHMDWRCQIEEFSRTHRVLALDNRGHGRSGVPDADVYSVECMASDAAAVIRHVGFNQFHLAGQSMGGAIAQEIAVRDPSAVRSLTLQDTSFWFGDHGVRGQPPRPVPPHIEAEQRKRRPLDAATAERCWKALLGWRGSESYAARFSMPVLIIYGEFDAPLIAEGSTRLRELISHAELAVIDDAGHYANWERAAEFNQVLRRFLEGASET